MSTFVRAVALLLLPLLAISCNEGSNATSPATIVSHARALGTCSDPGRFTPGGSMSQARYSHVAIRLLDGKVLLAGNDFPVSTTAELYDPESMTFQPTGGLNEGRCYGCGSLRLDDGRVLVAGGWRGGPVLASAELYDPPAASFAYTSGAMTTARLGPELVRVPGGKVFVFGGHNGFAPLGTAELYDPATQTFTAAGSAVVTRGTSATGLLDGRVLLAGGQSPGGSSLASAEIYDPATQSFQLTGSLASPRLGHLQTLLANGKVLVTGGRDGSNQVVATAELYDPGLGTFTSLSSMTVPREAHRAVVLPDGRVLIMGGSNTGAAALDSTEIFSPDTGTFTALALTTGEARAGAGLTDLGGGRFLLSGGIGNGGQHLASVTLFDACPSRVDVTVDPNGFAHQYRIPGTSTYNVQGTQVASLDFGPHELCIGNTCHPFSVNPDGTVSGPANDSLEFTGNVIRFRPSVPVEIDAHGAEVQWRIPGTSLYNLIGDQSGSFVPGNSWEICFHMGCLAFTVNADGSVSGGPNGSFDYVGHTLRFRPPLLMNVRPGGTSVGYYIPGTAIYNVQGPQAARFVPATTWDLCVGAQCVPFTVGPDCAITPSSVSFGASSFQLACGQPPVALCSNRSVCTSPSVCTGVANVDAGSHDLDGHAISLGYTPAGPYSRGATPVTLAVTAGEDQSSCAATVTVRDCEPPLVTCPAPIHRECTGPGGAQATVTGTARDNCDAVTPVCIPGSGAYPLGVTPLSCRAVDDAGNAGDCHSSVEVVDTTPPVVGSRDAGEIWPPNLAYRTVTLADCGITVDDACSGPMTLQAASAEITCVTSDEREGAAPGADIVIVDRSTVKLRAARSGSEDGRVYNIAFKVKDLAGNLQTGTCRAVVPKVSGLGAIDSGAVLRTCR
jgi:hypothetical protein